MDHTNCDHGDHPEAVIECEAKRAGTWSQDLTVRWIEARYKASMLRLDEVKKGNNREEYWYMKGNLRCLRSLLRRMDPAKNRELQQHTIDAGMED